MGAVILTSSVVGPVIGGAFTTHLTWRWCFFISLPVGGATIISMIWLLPSSNNKMVKESRSGKLSVREKIDQLDLIGTICFLPGVVCLLLALQWGGSTYAWSDPRIIILWVLFGLLMIVFAAVQV
jgi:MFS family permease